MALLEREVSPLIEEADQIFHLQQFAGDAVHDWGQVLDDFTELVTLDRSSERLTEIVMAED